MGGEIANFVVLGFRFVCFGDLGCAYCLGCIGGSFLGFAVSEFSFSRVGFAEGGGWGGWICFLSVRLLRCGVSGIFGFECGFDFVFLSSGGVGLMSDSVKFVLGFCLG